MFSRSGTTARECAALRWLTKTNVLAPRLYGYGLRNDPLSEVGVAYMLIDELPGRWNSLEASFDDGPFFLKLDDKGDHILVGDGYNITGIIDWTYARIVPTFEAFGPSLLTVNLNDMFNGKAGQSTNDSLMAEAVQSRDKHLGRIASGPDLVRRFSFVLGTATGIPLGLDLEVWRQTRIYQWAGDSRLQDLLRLQDEHSENKEMADDDADVPPELVDYLIASEYATLKFLEPTKIPAPKVFACGVASDPSNRVGVGFIIMEALPGKPFYAHEATPEQRRDVIQQLADILIESSKHPLPLAGSLVMKDGDQIDISAIASNRFVSLNTYGLLNTAIDYITNIIDQHMDLVADGQLCHKYPLEAFLFYRFLRQNIDALINPDIPGQFFLKHVDDNGDHLLVDDEFNTTGIIHWQFARTVPAAEASGPSYVTADLASLYSSNTN
ncbi:hypothetical protein UA08_01135 [Talaromyces atroroseus]|uniref:Aminoglycoside phosphotransferase domain-containing protein n=1 Tax=Talaromyces atroroseus TaxID=1441469 RepID=A0A1Q5Q9J3_TALAT|nr:hypothetical protein UA08_01135 [Talaromyces atroroseus]OKL62612.1 hypothetical protein UA08_01135 [Talaromyces atroroseus]